MLAPGTKLAGKYRIEGLLGRGGSGIVYAALQEPLGRRVAVKVLRRDPLVDPTFSERFRREAQAAAALHHPNLVAVTDLVTDGEHVFLVMERLVGASLSATIVKERALAQDRVATIGYEVLSGLTVAHAAGLVHRDVKPDNVFLVSVGEEDESAKLLDFGIVKRGSGDAPLTADSVIVGTWQYMPPEQCRGESVDGRADVYSLGASLFFAATCLRPHQAADMDRMSFGLSSVHAPGLASLRSDFDPAFCAVIDRALMKDLADRWPGAPEMRAALAAFTRKRLPGKTGGTVRLSEVPRPRSVAPAVAAPARSQPPEEDITTVGTAPATIPEPPMHDPLDEDQLSTVRKDRRDIPGLDAMIERSPVTKKQ